MTAITLRVVAVIPQGDVIHRLVLSGDELTPERFAQQPWAGQHIKLFFKTPEQAALTLPTRLNGKIIWPEPALKPIARTYSIYDYDPDNNELSVDFVLHDDSGIGSGTAGKFAKYAQIGDELGLAGPGPIQLTTPNKSQYIFAGDMCALPAFSAVANTLENTQITMFLETDSDKDEAYMRQYYLHNPRWQCHFIPRASYQQPNTMTDRFDEMLQQHPVTEMSVTLAGEHAMVVALRKLCRHHNVPKHALYAVPYWRMDNTEEEYHADRHTVMDN